VVRAPNVTAGARVAVSARNGGSFGAIREGRWRLGRTGSGWNSGGNGADGRNGQEVPPRRIYGRVCGWLAMHAVSLGHDYASSWRKLPLGLFLC
jgi:hypothetical protein